MKARKKKENREYIKSRKVTNALVIRNVVRSAQWAERKINPLSALLKKAVRLVFLLLHVLKRVATEVCRRKETELCAG
jgi:hypothetical protein